MFRHPVNGPEFCLFQNSCFCHTRVAACFDVLTCSRGAFCACCAGVAKKRSIVPVPRAACRGGIAMPGHAFRTTIVMVFCLDSHRVPLWRPPYCYHGGLYAKTKAKKGLAPASRMAPLHLYRVDAPLPHCDLCTCHRSALTMFARASDTHVSYKCSQCLHCGALCDHGVPGKKL